MEHHIRFLCELPTDADRIAVRFWAKVNRDGPVPANCPELGPCWAWTASKDAHGYGMILVYRALRRAHRVAWMLGRGPIPKDTDVLHHCDTPACVNYERHLFLGTHADNMQDMNAKGRNSWAGRGDTNGLRRNPHLVARGERQGHARLTEDQVRLARVLCKDRSQREVGEMLGVHQITVSDIITGKTWRHVQ